MAYPLIDGGGRMHGLFAIENISTAPTYRITINGDDISARIRGKSLPGIIITRQSGDQYRFAIADRSSNIKTLRHVYASKAFVELITVKCYKAHT